MRAPLILALSVIGTMVGCAAAAAEQPYRPAVRDDFDIQGAAPVVLDRFEPGVTMRAYWLSPWRGRHYYPHSTDFVRSEAAPAHRFPYADCRAGCGRHRHLRRPVARRRIRRTVINSRRIVRDPPLVIEHRRVVDDPPRVITRRHYVTTAPAHGGRVVISGDDLSGTAGGKRVIHADAEITILGPDRMTIRLTRQRGEAGGRAFDKQ